MTKKFNKSHFLELRRKLRKESTSQEIILWSRLRNNKLGVKFRRQYGIESYVVDFCCPSHKLIIELDGAHHFKNEIDKIRTEYLELLGFTFLRFWNDEIEENLDEVLQKIICSLALTRRGSG